MKTLDRLSIITPSLNMLPYLKRCVASVEDQSDAGFEHIVVDAVSSDGTVEWLGQKKDLAWTSEPDLGMYDAINKGFQRAHGRILAYLNCDEQYLPGTLAWVQSYFRRHEDVDVLFGDALLIRPDGSLIAFWKGYRPRWVYILSSYLYVLTCTMFLRRRIFEEGHRFKTEFKVLGDAEFVVRLLRSDYRIRHVRKYFSAYTMTGSNLSGDKSAPLERRLLLNHFPDYSPRWNWILNKARLMEKMLSGAYFQSTPLNYSVYTDLDSSRRTEFSVSRASSKWKDS